MKFEIINTKFKTISNKENPNSKPKKYDLEERTFLFAKNVCELAKNAPRTIANFEYLRQVIRSSGSVGANYIEANESLGKKDFLMHIKICRKEAKESRFWLSLLQINEDDKSERIRNNLIQEAIELMKIFSSIMRKSF